MGRIALLSLPLLLAAALAACGGDEPAPDATDGGDAQARSLLDVPLAGPGGVTCATCHAVDREFEAPAIAGPLVGHRKGYWGDVLEGPADTLEGAITLCLQRFVLKRHPDATGSYPPLSAEQREQVGALEAEISGEIAPSTPLSPRSIDFASRDDVARIAAMEADPERGAAVYRAVCAACHGPEGEGLSGNSLRGLRAAPSYTIGNVRLGEEGMPPFSLKALTDQQVADVAAFVEGL